MAHLQTSIMTIMEVEAALSPSCGSGFFFSQRTSHSRKTKKASSGKSFVRAWVGPCWH